MMNRAITLLFISVCFIVQSGIAAPTSRLAIITGKQSSEPELKGADMLQARILKRSSVTVQTAKEGTSEAADFIDWAEMVFVVGSPRGNTLSQSLMERFEAKLPTLPGSDQLHPEGFILKSCRVKGKDYLIIAGTDERGTIYGVGGALREMTYYPESIEVPELDVQEKPALWLRGVQHSGPGSRAQRYGDLRPQTGQESGETMEDMMLLGSNTYRETPSRMRPYGMMTKFRRTANEMPYKPDGSPRFPKEWAAYEEGDGIKSTRYVCPSIPEARKALLESFEEMFKNEKEPYEFFTTNAGDEGGCRCERCMPWGATFIKLCHEIAELLHKYHPDCKMQASNETLSVEGDQAILDYLNSQDSSWLSAIRYGAGSDQMQTYMTGPVVASKFFRYEGFGSLGNYLKYVHHQLPPKTYIALYSDITHWMQSQYGVEQPDMALASIYNRRSWNARPKFFHKVAREIFHYVIGDKIYSEGMHDDFNKWLWSRMLWNPNLGVEEITKEYCRYWCGPEAQDEMAKAIFLMEETLEKPVLGNDGIAKAVELLRSAGKKIPPNLKKIDYRWRIISQKALMDRYIQLMLERGEELKQQARKPLESAGSSRNPKVNVQRALKILTKLEETREMKRIKEEVRRLGEQSNKIIGYRVPAYFIVDKLDVTEVGWCVKTLQQALATGDSGKIRNAAKKVLYYYEPGEGGFYDNVGWPARRKRLIHGRTQWGFEPFDRPARLSHYNFAYSRGTETPITFAYDGLDPEAQYVVRITVGLPHVPISEKELSGEIKLPLREGLKADDVVVSDGFIIPVKGIRQYEFEIPRQTTQDGKVTISLVQLSVGTSVSEIWLMRKDKMLYTVD